MRRDLTVKVRLAGSEPVRLDELAPRRRAPTEADLMPGLLRQPGGFEGVGFLMVEEDLDSRGPSFLVQREDRPRKKLHLDSTARAPDRRAQVEKELVFAEAHLQRFEHLVVEGVRLEPGAIVSRPSNRGLTACLDEFDVRGGSTPSPCRNRPGCRHRRPGAPLRRSPRSPPTSPTPQARRLRGPQPSSGKRGPR